MKLDTLTVYMSGCGRKNYVYLPTNDSLLVFDQRTGEMVVKCTFVKDYNQDISFCCIFNKLPDDVQDNFERGVIEAWKKEILDSHIASAVERAYNNWVVDMVEKYPGLTCTKVDAIIKVLVEKNNAEPY